MIGGEHFYYNQGHVSSEAGITAGLRRKYTLSANYKKSHKMPQERNVGKNQNLPFKNVVS